MADIPPSLHPWILAWAALAGAAIGSFVNVVVARVPVGESIVRPGSRCPACKTPIAWYDNVPVISWMLLGARCRACRERISPRYPLVELAVGAVAVGSVLRHGPGSAAAAEFGFVTLLLALALIDLDTWLLPNVLTWPLLAGSVALAAAGVGGAGSLRASLLGAGLGFGAFAAVSVIGERVFHREALGFGDVWLLAGLGAFLGVKALLPVVLLASLQGVLVGGPLALLGKLPGAEEAPTGVADEPPPDVAAGPPAEAEEEEWVPPRNAVPFGPFLVVAALEWLYLSAAIAHVVPGMEIFR